MKTNKGTRPLMIYTSLIFIVAIIMVIVAYFGQRHLESAQIRQTETTMGISERASQLSDENRLLMENNRKLTDENDDLRSQNVELSEQNTALTKEAESARKLLAVYSALYAGNKASARRQLAAINSEDLTSEQKGFYDILAKKSE